MKGLPVLCDRRELPAKAIKKIASMVKTHAALHAYSRSVHLPRRRPGAPRNGTETMTAASIRLFFKAARRP